MCVCVWLRYNMMIIFAWIVSVHHFAYFSLECQTRLNAPDTNVTAYFTLLRCLRTEPWLVKWDRTGTMWFILSKSGVDFMPVRLFFLWFFLTGLDSGLYVQSCLDTEITDTPLAYIVLYGNYSMDVVGNSSGFTLILFCSKVDLRSTFQSDTDGDISYSLSGTHTRTHIVLWWVYWRHSE